MGALKGGVAKTTTSIHVAIGLSRLDGGRVLLVDADPQAASTLDWSTVAGENWPASVTVIPWHGPDLARRVAGVVDDYDHLVIDTGGENDVILGQALTVTDELVIPISPSLLELRRLPSTIELASRVDVVSPLTYRVLLCKVRTGTRSAADARALLTDLDVPCMDAEVHLREAYISAFGSVPANLGDYEAVLTELLEDEDVGVTS